MKVLTICSLLFFAAGSLLAQDITNTLGNSGFFYIKDGATTFLTLKQSNGYLGLGTTPNAQLEITKSFRLPATSDATTGVIYKGTQSFLHNYKNPAGAGYNVFLGVNSGNFSLQMVSNSSDGSFNTGVGDGTLTSLTTGRNNTALGYLSLNSLNTGIQNSAVGGGALQLNTSGNYNTAVGFQALNELTTGGSNTALGFGAGNNNISGSNNIIIGYGSQTTTTTVSNEISLGNVSNNRLRCAVTSITSLSDKRDKKNIHDLSLGLDFISKLKPRQFNWDKREWYPANISDGSKTEKKLTAGFIAQELDSAQTEAGAEWLDLVYKSNPEKLEATYGNLLPVIVKAIQELKEQNDELSSYAAKLTDENEQLKNKLSSLSEIEKVMNEIKELKKEIVEGVNFIKSSGINKTNTEEISYKEPGK